MIIPDMVKLYEPYTKDGGTLEGAIRWLKKTIGVEDDIVQSVMAETFLDLASGKDFLGDCDCGCEMKGAHTRIEHHMGLKCRELKQDAEIAYATAVQKTIQARMLAHIQEQNDQFIKDNTKKNRLVDWSKSPVLNMFKRKKEA